MCYEENGEGGFTSDLSTSVSSFFTSFFAFLITFFASFLTSFFLCFDFFPFLTIASIPCCAANDLNLPALQKKNVEISLRSSPRLHSAANFDLRLTTQPSFDVFTHHISRKTVALLDHTFKLFALSVDLSQIVIGELAPLLFDAALMLLPISFDAVPVHFTRLLELKGSPPKGTSRHAWGSARTSNSEGGPSMTTGSLPKKLDNNRTPR